MRVFLLLLAIQCLPDEERLRVDADVRYDPPYRLVRIARPRMKGMRRARIGGVTVYTRPEKTEWGTYYLNLVADRGGAWFQLHDDEPPDSDLPLLGGGPFQRVEDDRWPVVEGARHGLPIVRVSWTEQWTDHDPAARRTVLLDFRDKPRVRVSIACWEVASRGFCSGREVAFFPRRELTCDDDLRCTMRQTVFLGWTSRAATRTFDLLTNKPFAPSRFDAVRYASGAAFAAAGPDAVRQRALIDGIGVVQPVHELSPGKILFAAHALEPVVGFRFFLLARGTWREIPATLLSDSRYPGNEEDLRERAGSISRGFTPEGPSLSFSASAYDLPGRRKVIRVVGAEGDARSVHWIMLDPAGRTGALRMASDQPEWRHCGNVVYPLSVTSIEWTESGLPVFATAMASWRRWDIEEGPMPRTCDVRGEIGWSTRHGWTFRFFQEPCTDPRPRPHAVQIRENGTVSVETVTFSH